MSNAAAQDLRSGEIGCVWGTILSTAANASSAVLAYEKKAATEGGWVLMQDGKVKRMTASEFQAAPKAAPL
jgi:hypothetical protein